MRKLMNTEELINYELKNAIKSADRLRMDTLRSIRAAFIEFNKSGSGKELTDDESFKILNSLAKKRKDAIELYEKGNRKDLADKERIELSIIREFLQKQLSEDEIRDIAINKTHELGITNIKDMGKLIGLIMKEYSGKVDGSIVQKIVKEIFVGK